MHVNEPGVRSVPITPDLLEQDLAGEDLTGFAGQRDEEIELERGQVDWGAVASYLVRGHIDRDR